MTTQTNWMIAAAGTDAIQAREAGFTCLHLCARLSADGTFSLLAHPANSRGDFLGIADSGGVPRKCGSFAFDAASAALIFISCQSHPGNPCGSIRCGTEACLGKSIGIACRAK